MTICHYSTEDDSWHVIEVNVNALPAHLAHGDVQLVDEDGDGWVAAENACVPGGDCNDDNAAIYPGATEVCDGFDNDCDGQTDEGVQTTFYADADGDGYGNADDTQLACSAPDGYVTDNTDCDDTVYNLDNVCDEYEIDHDGPLYVALEDEFADARNWAAAKNACALKAQADGRGWRLADAYEIFAIYQAQNQIGGFTSGRYWTTTVTFGGYIYTKDFSNGIGYLNHYTETHYCRCVHR